MASAEDIAKIYNRFNNGIKKPVVTAEVIGTPATTEYRFGVTAVNEAGETNYDEVIVSNGPTSLTGVNYIKLTWEEVENARTYNVYGRISGSIGQIITLITDLEYSDQGVGIPNISITAPSSNLTSKEDWDDVSFIPAKPVQSAEANEIQKILAYKIEKLANTLFKAGDLITGAEITVDTDTNTVYITEGTVYIEGAIRYVPEAEITITGSGTEEIGLKVESKYIDSVDDETLLDPAQVNPGYANQGALRGIIEITWVLDDPIAIQVWRLVDAQLFQVKYTPEFSELEKTLARRTFDISGQVLIYGYEARFFPHLTRRDKVIIEVDPGKAYVNGYEVEKPLTTKLIETISKDVKSVTGETIQITYSDDGYLYSPDGTPVSEVSTVTAHVKKSETRTISATVASNGGCEETNGWHIATLSETSIHEVLGVWTDGTKAVPWVYGCAANDYTIEGGEGNPSQTFYISTSHSPGSTFYVEYLYNKTMTKGVRVKTQSNDSANTYTKSGLGPYNLNDEDPIHSTNNKVWIEDEDENAYVEGVDFDLDDGRDNTSIGTASITWQSGVLADGKDFTIKYYYWDHTTEGDYVSVDSYLDDADPYQDYTYDDIEYPNKIDFRPSGTKPSTENDDIIATYDYFLSQEAWLVLDQSGNFTVVRSKSADTPVIPSRPFNKLPKYTITFNAFSQNLFLYEESRYDRLTQFDLNILGRRISSLEHDLGVGLANIELDNKGDVKPIDFIIDTFRNLNFVNTSTLTCGMDLIRGILKLDQTVSSASILEDNINSTVRIGNKLITKTFSEVDFIEQLVWTKDFAQAVNPYSAYAPVTGVDLYPETDLWFTSVIDETAVIPKIVKTVDKLILLPLRVGGSQDVWRTTIANAINVDKSLIGWVPVSRNYGTTILNLTLNIGTEEVFKILDFDYLPYLRQIVVIMHIKGCPPNEDNISATFDDTAISLEVALQAEIDAKNLNLTATGLAGTNPGTVKADSNGEVIAKFTVPENIRTGQRVVAVTSDSGDVDGDASYFGLGMLKHYKKIVKLLQQRFNLYLKWYSPLAESILIEEDIFITSISIWMYRVPDDNDLGLKLSLRNMTESGLPGQDNFGQVYLSQDEIRTQSGIDSSNVLSGDPSESNGKVTFTFDDPVFLEGGKEYCFAIEDQAPGYSVFTSRVGKTVIGDLNGLLSEGDTLTAQPYNGVMFVSVNNTTWEPIQDADIMFRIKRAQFDTSEQTLKFNQVSGTNYSEFVHISEGAIPLGCYVDYEYSYDGALNYFSYLPVKSEEVADSAIEPNNIGTESTNLDLKIVFNTDSDKISPIIHRDMQFLSLYEYEMSGVYSTLEVDKSPTTFDSLIAWIDEYQLTGTTFTYEVSFDSGSTWYTLPSVSTRVSDIGFTERELGGTVDTITSSAISSASKFIIRITLETSSGYEHNTPKNRRLRVKVY